MTISADALPDRLQDVPFEEWVPLKEMRPGDSSSLVNTHGHHDTNPWGWDGLRVVAELWNRGVSRLGVVAFDSSHFIDSIADLALYSAETIPTFIEAIVLTPGEGEVWNDLPGRMYIQAGPFYRSAEAAALSDALVRRARRRAEYQAARWNERLDLGFTYQPNWEGLQLQGVTEANLSRDLVEAIQSHSPDPAAVWRQIPGLDADPGDANFARAFRNATMVAEDAVARVPRTPDYYLSTEEFLRLASGRAHYMYVGKPSGFEADREALLERAQSLGFAGLCAIPQRNLDTPENAADFARFLGLLQKKEIPTILGTELNAHGQWWHVDLDASPFAAHRGWLDQSWDWVRGCADV